jgi:hypothetical protein
LQSRKNCYSALLFFNFPANSRLAGNLLIKHKSRGKEKKKRGKTFFCSCSLALEGVAVMKIYLFRKALAFLGSGPLSAAQAISCARSLAASILLSRPA